MISGQSADVTACLLSQILAGEGRCALCAVSARYGGSPEELLSRLEGLDCRHAVVALPEDRAGMISRRIDTAVILTRGMGEAAGELVGRSRHAVINLDDPDGAVQVPLGVRRWTFSERRDEADVTAKNLRLLPFRTEFEAVTACAITRLSVPLPDGRGLYPGLAAAAAALTFGVGMGATAARLRRAGPVPAGMIPLPGAGPFAAAGYFEPETERIREI